MNYLDWVIGPYIDFSELASFDGLRMSGGGVGVVLRNEAFDGCVGFVWEFFRYVVAAV